MTEKKHNSITAGCELTLNSDIINISGKIIFKKGHKVVVREVLKSGGYWGKMSGYWIDERIDGVKLEGRYGIWSLSTFMNITDTLIKK